ncbi:MAG TPA: TatD family hydrolase [Pyrinomonadaceae bacterium]|nr:TatD family hydrolase [Pyrinomonadaceae bacterium]
MLIDSHCHIDSSNFDADRDEVVQRALDAGVGLMVNIGTGDPRSDDFCRAVEVAEKYPQVYAAVGVHPHDAKLYDDAAEQHLIDLVGSSKKVIAWGEIGLDFYYDHTPRDVQRDVFRRQIRTARTLSLPIIIHSREADDETVAILREECAGDDFPGGIMHCFGGTPEMAQTLMPLGFLISFAGNVTFKKAQNLRDAAAVVPIDKILVETDCPFLTPEPLRGKQNEPSYVAHTAKFLAELKGVDPDTFGTQTTQNFLDFFGSRIEA